MRIGLSPPGRARRPKPGWKKTVRLFVVGAVCLTVAALLARWWTLRAEAVFESHLRVADQSELTRIARGRPWNPQVFYWLGVRLTEQGQHADAVNALARSTALNPKSAASRAALGLALARADQPEQAEAQLREATRLAPRFGFAYFTLGSLYGRYHRWQQAAGALKKAVALNPRDHESRFLLAQCYGELFQEDLKMDELERLTKQAPNEIRFLKSLGYVYIFFGKFAQAETLYRRVIALAPGDLETQYLLGRALAEQATTPAAFADAEKMLRAVSKKVSDEPGVPLALGILYFRRGEPARAVPEFERAIRLGTTENKTYLYLGQVYARVGRQKDAERTLGKFQHGASVNRTVTHLENRLLNLPEETNAQRQEKAVLRLRAARVYLADDDYRHALSHVRLIVEQDAGNQEAQRLLRICEAHLAAPVAASAARPPGVAPSPGP